jgi:alpha-2-macroglobulin-like protein
MKRYLLLFLLLSATFSIFAQVNLPELLKLKLESYNRILPYEKVYVQCDRPLYKPGDDIWMAVWITDGITNKASNISEILTVELVNPKGNIEETRRLIATKGRATCDFTLDSLVSGGIYKIKAYTNWMKNFGEENSFEKDIQVQQIALPKLKMKLEFEKKAYGAGDTVHAKLVLGSLENQPLSDYGFTYNVNLNGTIFQKGTSTTDKSGKSVITFSLPSPLNTNDGLLNVMISFRDNTESISRSIPIILNQLDLQFFPEGGDLVAGTTNNCAFKALNEFGKPADLEGTVFNSKHKIVAQFKSYHQGMGAFRFEVQKGENYYALIDRPQGILQLYLLPQPVDKGYKLEIPSPLQFIIPNEKQTASILILSPESTTVSLVGQVNGKIYYSAKHTVKIGENKLDIPLAAFPSGVAQLLYSPKKTSKPVSVWCL